MSHCGIEPQSDPCQGSILTIILVGQPDFKNLFYTVRDTLKNLLFLESYSI